jgi:hypothetical protein
MINLGIVYNVFTSTPEVFKCINSSTNCSTQHTGSSYWHQLQTKITDRHDITEYFCNWIPSWSFTLTLDFISVFNFSLCVYLYTCFVKVTFKLVQIHRQCSHHNVCPSVVIWSHHIGGVMVSVFVSSAVDRGFESWSG